MLVCAIIVDTRLHYKDTLEKAPPLVSFMMLYDLLHGFMAIAAIAGGSGAPAPLKFYF